MPTDLETEVIQLLAATEAVNDLVSVRLRPYGDSLTIPQSGARTGEEHEIAGLSQILEISQAYLLEISIKLLHTKAVPDVVPAKTHDLSCLFLSLPTDVQKRLSDKWIAERSLTPRAASTSFSKFLTEHSGLFEGARYLWQREKSPPPFSSVDVKTAVLLVIGEAVSSDSDGVLLQNMYRLAQRKMRRSG